LIYNFDQMMKVSRSSMTRSNPAMTVVPINEEFVKDVGDRDDYVVDDDDDDDDDIEYASVTIREAPHWQQWFDYVSNNISGMEAFIRISSSSPPPQQRYWTLNDFGWGASTVRFEILVESHALSIKVTR
jgi:hypothetical protein